MNPEPDYISHLNPRQKEAVLATDGPVSVLAGAGSGQTAVLTTRIYHLIRLGIPPERILAVTFTNKAAREMRERLYAKLGYEGDVNPFSTRYPIPFIATFHGLGRELLQQYGSALGIPKRFTIAPDDYHVPYAGTAEDGRKFFLSNELFDFEHSYVGLFLWKADGTFDRVEVEPVERPTDVPPGQAAAAGADSLVQDKLASLGDYTLERTPVGDKQFEQFRDVALIRDYGFYVVRQDSVAVGTLQTASFKEGGAAVDHETADRGGD